MPGTLMQECDRVLAELQVSGAVPVTQEPVERSETPVHSEPTAGPVALPSPVRPASPSPTPSADVPTVDVRAAVRLVLSHCRAVKDQGVLDWIQCHPQRWGLWADEFNGVADMLSELFPADLAAVRALAAESIYLWVRVEMKLIGVEVFQRWNRGLWEYIRGVRA